MKLQDCVVLVFGGGKGIGRAYVEALVREDCKVYFVDINNEAGQNTLSHLSRDAPSRIAFQLGDICSEQDLSKAFQDCRSQFQGLDIVVNTVGLADESNWERTLQVNLAATIQLINKTILELGKENGGKGGCFIATSSVTGIMPHPCCPVYSAVKHAITALVRSWALPENFSRHGIRMNCVCPFITDTDFLKEALQPGRMYNQELITKGLELDPRIVQPAQVAEGLLLLLKDENLNGKAVRVSVDNGIDFEPYENISHPER